MLKKLTGILILVFCVATQIYALDANELKNSAKNLTWADINDIYQIVENKAEETAINTGHVQFFNWGGAGGFYFFKPTNLSSKIPAGLDNISLMYGGAGGFMVSIAPKIAIGGLFGGFGGESSKKIGADFTQFYVGGAFQLAYGKYKLIIDPTYMLDIDCGLGIVEGAYVISKSDETTIKQDVLRSNAGLAYLLGLDFRYRFTPTFFSGIKAGYFGGKITNLKRADFTDSGNDLDLSNLYIGITCGGNF